MPQFQVGARDLASGQILITIAAVEHNALNILYVDDDRNDLALFTLAVDQADVPAWVATGPDGDHAIEYLEGAGVFQDRSLHPLPDVVVLDLRMTRSTGFDFLKWRRNSRFKSIPVIAFTASDDVKDTRQALDLGADLCLRKPVGFNALKQTVREIWEFSRNEGKAQAGCG